MSLLALALPPHLKAGDRWSAERTIRFTSRAAEIDMQNDDHFEYVVGEANGKSALILKRRQTGTHLPDGTLVPTPAGGEAVETDLPMTDSGGLEVVDQPEEDLERMLAEVYIAAWNEAGAKTKFWSIAVTLVSPNRERIRFEQAPMFGPASLEGDVELDAKTHVPISMSLSGKQFKIPGGGDRVSIHVEYTAKRVGA